jgi:hypothetical protein
MEVRDQKHVGYRNLQSDGMVDSCGENMDEDEEEQEEGEKITLISMAITIIQWVSKQRHSL